MGQTYAKMMGIETTQESGVPRNLWAIVVDPAGLCCQRAECSGFHYPTSSDDDGEYDDGDDNDDEDESEEDSSDIEYPEDVKSGYGDDDHVGSVTQLQSKQENGRSERERMYPHDLRYENGNGSRHASAGTDLFRQNGGSVATEDETDRVHFHETFGPANSDASARGFEAFIGSALFPELGPPRKPAPVEGDGNAFEAGQDRSTLGHEASTVTPPPSAALDVPRALVASETHGQVTLADPPSRFERVSHEQTQPMFHGAFGLAPPDVVPGVGRGGLDQQWPMPSNVGAHPPKNVQTGDLRGLVTSPGAAGAGDRTQAGSTRPFDLVGALAGDQNASKKANPFGDTDEDFGLTKLLSLEKEKYESRSVQMGRTEASGLNRMRLLLPEEEPPP